MHTDNETVLVVDDDVVISHTLQIVLERAGYRVIVAESGAVGIRYVEEYAPDLILLDIMLPDIDGYEVYRRIREIRKGMLIPVIFITALDEEVMLQDCREIGQGVDYILKPVRPEILLARIANILAVVRSRKELAERNEQLEKEIAKRDRLAVVVRQCQDSIFIVNPSGTIVYANPASEINSGYSIDELVGKQFEELPHVEKEDSSFQEMVDHVFAGQPWRGNIQNVKKDGSVYLEEIVLNPVLAEGGEIQGHVVVMKDITERRRLESIASSVNLMDNVGFVFSGIRHELGNPVNSLKMTLSVLNKKIDSFPPDIVTDFLDRSLHEISRIEYLLNSLRSFSMFEHPVASKVALPEFFKNLVGIHCKDLESARIQINLAIAADAGEVFADERALLQVMLNLLSNAVNALEGMDEPVITIDVLKESSRLVCVSLKDNGCGISEHNQELLFKPFFTTRASGTGLGLVIVKKMLAEMDCSIQVKSKEDEGTVVSILLPTDSVQFSCCDRDSRKT